MGVGYSYSPRDSQECSPTLQFKSINSSALSFLYSLTLTSIHDYWKNHSFDYLSLNLAIRSSWSEPQSAPNLVFADYRASPSLAAKNVISLILVLTIWWCPCVESSLVLLEEGVCYHQCILLTKHIAYVYIHENITKINMPQSTSNIFNNLYLKRKSCSSYAFLFTQ